MELENEESTSMKKILLFNKIVFNYNLYHFGFIIYLHQTEFLLHIFNTKGSKTCVLEYSFAYLFEDD